jgi:Leucine-rich repeat (LRR) protein
MPDLSGAVAMPEPIAEKPARRRGLSLRVLMLLVLVIGGGQGWWSYRARVQRQAVAEIEAAGGRVLYDWRAPKDVCTSLYDSTLPPPWPRWLVKAVGIDYLANASRVSPGSSENSVFDDRVLGDDLMKRTARLGLIRSLVLQQPFSGYFPCRVTDSGLVHLRELGRLEDLQIRGAPGITDAGLVHLEGLTRLRQLVLDETSVQGHGLKSLAGLTRLELLHISCAPTDLDIAPLGDLVSLRCLVLSSTRLTDRGLARLKGLTTLKVLQLVGGRSRGITSAGLVHLQGMRQLERLSLSHTSVTSLEPLSRLSQLTGIDLDDTPIDDEGLTVVADLPRLELLSLVGTNITDAGLAHLAGSKSLTSLDLSGTKITDAGLVHLNGIKHLESLDLLGTKVSPAGVGILKKAFQKPPIISY